jgi:hypothetical protein
VADDEMQVGSTRPTPVPTATPWWMRHTVGEVAAENRIAIASTAGAGVMFLLLIGIAAALSIYKVSAADRIWDIIQSVLGGSAGGGIVA